MRKLDYREKKTGYTVLTCSYYIVETHGNLQSTSRDLDSGVKM